MKKTEKSILLEVQRLKRSCLILSVSQMVQAIVISFLLIQLVILRGRIADILNITDGIIRNLSHLIETLQLASCFR